MMVTHELLYISLTCQAAPVVERAITFHLGQKEWAIPCADLHNLPVTFTALTHVWPLWAGSRARPRVLLALAFLPAPDQPLVSSSFEGQPACPLTWGIIVAGMTWAAESTQARARVPNVVIEMRRAKNHPLYLAR